MPYDPLRRIQTPDFYPDQMQQGWQDMGQDQPIDIRPAAGAFKKRFMTPNNPGEMPNSTPTMNDMPEIDVAADAGGGAPVKKGLKSL